MNQKYCIYLNKLVSEDNLSPEHIIPLSLGGSDEFVLPVDAETNKRLGGKIDGRLTKDYIMSSIRRKNNYRGHTKKAPKSTFKASKFKDSGKPLIVTFGKDTGSFYDPISKSEIPKEEMVGRSFEMNLKIDRYARPLFIVKTLLSAGYYIFGDQFLNFCDHESLRKFMNFEHNDSNTNSDELPLSFNDPLFGEPPNQPNIGDMLDKICKAVGCSCVIFLYYHEYLIGSVGIAGNYLGAIQFKAELSRLPKSDKFEHGHVIGIQDGEIRRSSVRTIVNKCFGVKEKADNRHYHP